MRARLGELARVVRSKNAGPYTLTIDLVFDSPECAEAVARSLDPGLVARLYRVDPASVEVILYPPREGGEGQPPPPRPRRAPRRHRRLRGAAARPPPGAGGGGGLPWRTRLT